MTSPADVARFHAEFDRHPDDRVHLFGAIAELVPPTASVLYPGSYIDIGPSVWFDDVTYVDVDKRAARFFAQGDPVVELVKTKRSAAAGSRPEGEPTLTFHHQDYQQPLPVEEGAIDLLVSLYAGFISEHCGHHVRPDGFLLANDSHGDASLASLDERFELAYVVEAGSGHYRLDAADGSYLQPKRGGRPSAEGLHETGRGIAYTRSPFAYVFRARG